MKIAFIAVRVPYPLDAGGKIRTYHLLAQLSKVHDVTLITATESRTQEAALAELRRRLPTVKYRVVGVPPRSALHRRLARILSSPFDSLPYTWAGFRHPRFVHNVSVSLRAEDFDVVHCDHIQVAPALVGLKTPPRVINAHNVDSILIGRVADNETRAWRRGAIAWQAEKTRRAERALYPAFHAAIAVSGVDREHLRQLAPGIDVDVVPNGVDVAEFAPSSDRPEPGLMVFAAAMDWLPNVEGVRWFVRHVLPLIKARVPGARVVIVGRSPAPALVRELSGSAVSFTGTVADVKPFMHRASLIVVPLLSGGGTRLKILEAWAMAKPVVSTPVGAEGLPAVDGENIALGRSPGEFAASAADLLGDPSAATRIGLGGHRVATERYDWSRVVQPLLDVYERVGRPARPAARGSARPRTVLMYHEDSRLDGEALAAWLATVTDLSGLVVLREHRARRIDRLRREYRRSGLRGLLDVLAFRAYYRLALARGDERWRTETLQQMRARYPIDLEGVPRLVVADPNSAAVREFLGSLRVDMMIARCKFILQPKVFDIPTHGTFVLHPGICPEYRNAHGCFWALANRDLRRVGMTLLRVDKGVDTGPIFLQATSSYDERRESHVVIQDRMVLDNLDAIEKTLLDVWRDAREPLAVEGRKSSVWGQPRLTTYVRWKRAARRVQR